MSGRGRDGGRERQRGQRGPGGCGSRCEGWRWSRAADAQDTEGQDRGGQQDKDDARDAADRPWDPVGPTIFFYHELEIGRDGDQDHCNVVMPAARVGQVNQRPRGFLQSGPRPDGFQDLIVPDQVGESVAA